MKKLSHKEFGDRFIRKEVFIIVPVILLFSIIALSGGEHSMLKTVLVILIILVSVAGTVWQGIRLKKFRCPQCGKPIPSPVLKYRKDGDPIDYYCPDCDIEWDTGLTESTSS